MGFISSGTTILDAGAFDVSLGSQILLSTQTASSSASISFTTGIDSTYDVYQFEFINMHPATANTIFQFQTSTNGGSSYGVTYTNTVFLAYHLESGAGSGLGYEAGRDQAQSTSFASLCAEVARGGDADQACSGTLTIFNPASTTFVKHCISRFIKDAGTAEIFDQYQAGYMNTSSAIDAVQFKFSSGNIDDGTIKMYGIKGS
jgi:hypothetical protein